jgi:Zn-dependent protease with chaperone function
VLAAAGALAVCLLLLAVVIPGRLARAGWTGRSPGLALLLWQALGLAGGLLAIQVAATVALSPAGPTHVEAVRSLSAGTAAAPPVWAGIALSAAVLVLLRLLSVLLASAVQTLRARRRNRVLVDLVATRNPLLPGARVVEHAAPVAYCLPGLLRPRVVLSSGVLVLLREEEVRAVLAHESAHVQQRHDLVVLPFVALRATFPRLPGVHTTVAQVALLVELLADDRAARRHPREVLARALYKVGAGQVPAGGLAAGGDTVLLRAQRLLEPARPLPLSGRVAVLAATAGTLALTPLGLLLPLVLSG